MYSLACNARGGAVVVLGVAFFVHKQRVLLFAERRIGEGHRIMAIPRRGEAVEPGVNDDFVTVLRQPRQRAPVVPIVKLTIRASSVPAIFATAAANQPTCGNVAHDRRLLRPRLVLANGYEDTVLISY